MAFGAQVTELTGSPDPLPVPRLKPLAERMGGLSPVRRPGAGSQLCPLPTAGVGGGISLSISVVSGKKNDLCCAAVVGI